MEAQIPEEVLKAVRWLKTPFTAKQQKEYADYWDEGDRQMRSQDERLSEEDRIRFRLAQLIDAYRKNDWKAKPQLQGIIDLPWFKERYGR